MGPPVRPGWRALAAAGAPALGVLGLAVTVGLAAIALPVDVAGSTTTAVAGERAVAEYQVVDGQIPEPLNGLEGNRERGREIVLDSRRGNCVICHRIASEPDVRFPGDIGPDLSEIGRRASAGTLRLRLVDATVLNPRTVMPAYHRVRGLARVDPAYAGLPVLTAGEIEDVIAYLLTLR